MAHGSHVPKFGNWDGDNVEYTACFESARNDKGRTTLTMINPNDPEQNPEAFTVFTGSGGGTDDAAAIKASSGSRSALSRNSNSFMERSSHRSTGSRGSFTPDSVSEKSNHSDHSVLHRRDRKKSMSKGGSIESTSSLSSPGYHRRGGGSHYSRDFDYNEKGTPVPKFGQWDEKDPKSGEGYTLIFSKVKEEKQIESGHLPNVPSQVGNSKKNKYRGHPTRSSKFCCFVFK